MSRRYDESLAVLHYDGKVAFNLEAMAAPLTKALERRGFVFDVVGMSEDCELQYISAKLIVTVACDTDRPSQIQISAETPRDGSCGDGVADRRFRALTAATLQIFGQITPHRVLWRHEDKTYAVPSARPEPATLATVGTSLSAAPRAAAPAGKLDTLDPDFFDKARAELRARLDATVEAVLPEASEREQHNVCETVTLYALNTTVMVLSLPIGAGLMTYNLIRGGTIAGTSRALALTGTACGLTTLTATQGLASGSDLGGLLPVALTLAHLF
ncbi:hypothetical protein [Oceaniglobus roseus]|uniref:hypothetical protein n=1 Tax=Oceaniglobus roseus TaxID=1737570 RepID=UPI001562A157|nr:hypothetical protein [Kandeliimicrobium roseum]